MKFTSRQIKRIVEQYPTVPTRTIAARYKRTPGAINSLIQRLRAEGWEIPSALAKCAHNKGKTKPKPTKRKQTPKKRLKYLKKSNVKKKEIPSPEPTKRINTRNPEVVRVKKESGGRWNWDPAKRGYVYRKTAIYA